MNSERVDREDRISDLIRKALWVKRETLKIHKLAPETRLASSLSDIEIFVALYYGKILKYDAKNPQWEKRDRLIVSKGHGGISLYPILADVGYFEPAELSRVCKPGSFLGGIPDTLIPGFETINGSLGNGLGLGCGMALALKRKGLNAKVFVVMGDGELNEGSVWEAVMFAAQHALGNLLLILDNNQKQIVGYCKQIIDLAPLEEKFGAFRWKVTRANGHDMQQLYETIVAAVEERSDRPKLVIADTVKGKGVPILERDPLCHVKALSENEVDVLLREME